MPRRAVLWLRHKINVNHIIIALDYKDSIVRDAVVERLLAAVILCA
jgi:hypothetical protein